MSGGEAMETCPTDVLNGSGDVSHFFTRSELNKIIMNYLVTEGYQDACETFRKESGVQPHVPLETLDNRVKVHNAIASGRILEAISLVESIYPSLLDNSRHLCFRLQKQHLVELIRERRVEEALDYAQTNLAEEGRQNADILQELEQVMALLAFTDPQNSPFSDLLLDSQRHKLASEINEMILKSENQNASAQLTSIYKLLLWTQQELDQKKVKYDRMIDLASGSTEASNL